MNNASQPGSMFDGKFFITMALVFAAWVGWQSYLAKKYPDAYKAKNTAATPATSTPDTTASTATDATPAAPTGAKVLNEKPEVVAETKTSFEDNVWTFDISSRGMGLKNIRLKLYKDRQGEPVLFAAEDDVSLFTTSLAGRREPVNFAIKRVSDNEFVGTADVDGMKVTKILNIDSASYSVKTQVRAEKLSDSFTGFTTGLSERLLESKGGSFLAPTFEHQEFFVLHDGSETRTVVDNSTATVETFAMTKIAALGSQYFSTAIIDRSPTMAEFKFVSTPGEKAVGIGNLTHALLNKAESFSIEYLAFAGPKSYDLLKTVDADMTRVVNLGFFSSIAKGILWLMKTIHAAIGNWGVAIIFLTILVRILVLPFNVMGYKQMRAMTKIQPQMKSLREKYKNDPQRLNQEMLALMKESKANPLGGCLPMFLQIPIFFALYQVIGQSIELYQAPFMLWIHDLSLKDPYYILPALMGITMFIQQKITPNTLEPAQQKIMMILPIFFTFLMISLPSGLTLYIFISSVFGVLQQLYFTKDSNSVGAKA